jgi:hypothetical protein
LLLASWTYDFLWEQTCRYLTILLSYKSCKVCGMTKNNISYRMHTIAIDDENYQTLKGLGSVGDSFNDAVRGLIKIAKRRVEERQNDRG